MADVLLARRINQQSGGVVVAPWEVRDLPDDVLDVFQALAFDLPSMQQAHAAKEKAFADARERHPSYRKYV